VTLRRTLAVVGPALALLGPALLATARPTLAQPSLPHRVAVLQGLDKVTARIEVIEVPIGAEVRFGGLAIRARACYETPPTEPPESAAFLEIDEMDPEIGTGDSRKSAFVGWMFASTPGISALEHPVFDVWVIDCREPLAAPLEREIEPAPQQ
jgi:hypothetical protein